LFMKILLAWRTLRPLFLHSPEPPPKVTEQNKDLSRPCGTTISSAREWCTRLTKA
jgi:hypothetical protein